MVRNMKHRKNIKKTIVYDKQTTLVSQNMTDTVIVSSYSQKPRVRKIQIPRKIKILSSIILICKKIK